MIVLLRYYFRRSCISSSSVLLVKRLLSSRIRTTSEIKTKRNIIFEKQQSDNYYNNSKISATTSFSENNNLLQQLNPDSVRLSDLQKLITARKYLLSTTTTEEKDGFSPEFFDFLISWCEAKLKEVEAGLLDPVHVSLFAANILHSIDRASNEIMKDHQTSSNKKQRPPPIPRRSKFFYAISRLYFPGVRKLASAAGSMETTTKATKKVSRILCLYANACCNFDFDPTTSISSIIGGSADFWKTWFQVAKMDLEKISSQDEDEAAATAVVYLLSIILNVALRFRRFEDFAALRLIWESSIAANIDNFKQRNLYILSLRMAEFEKRTSAREEKGREEAETDEGSKGEIEKRELFKHVVCRKLVQAGVRRSMAEYEHRTGRGRKPNRVGDEEEEENTAGGAAGETAERKILSKS